VVLASRYGMLRAQEHYHKTLSTGHLLPLDYLILQCLTYG